MPPPIRHKRSKEAGPQSLDDIFGAPDEYGLLGEAPPPSVRSSSAPIQVSRFDEISAFVDTNGREPDQDAEELSERVLARRLQGYRMSEGLRKALRGRDHHGLLNAPPVNTTSASSSAQNVNSLEDIFSSDEMGLLDDEASELFHLVHVPQTRESPDEVASRTKCREFDKFEPLFTRFHKKLRAGELEVVRFNQSSQIRPDDVFILNGMLCYVAEVGEDRKGPNGANDPRLRVIFENGTESNLLLLSLGKALYKDPTGRRVLRGAESVVEDFNNITERDKPTGVIYIVRSKSENPKLKQVPNLHKIGFTETTAQQRIRNAVRDIAFLESEVEICAEFQCYNLNPRRFETLIHGFLQSHRLKVTLTSRDGNTYHPREWFSIPLDTAREVARRIADGSIVNFRLDNTRGVLIEKKTVTRK